MPTPTTSCPACGGPIHAIAGRCKHCKTDLVTYRARAAKAARDQAMGVPPPPGPAPAPAAAPVNGSNGHAAVEPAPVVEAPQPAPPSPARPVAEQRPARKATHSKFSRRWPIVVGAIALLVIGASIGILVERWRTASQSEEATSSSALPPVASSTPRPVPDNMPTVPPTTPQPTNPFTQPTPPPNPNAGSPNAQNLDLFATALSNTLCDKFKECGLDPMMTQMVCDTLDKAVRDELQSSGKQCSYDPVAGEKCLRAISKIQCDASQQGADIIDWMSAAGSATECMNAYRCP